jgi:uncharacterized protein YbaP (TraB family)
MKRLYATLLAALVGLAAGATHAQDGANCPPQATPPTPQQLQQAQARAKDRGFLWRVSKDGRTHHLYGTIHVGTLDWAVPGPRVRTALLDAQAIALEIDPLDPGIQNSLRGGGSAAPKLAPALAEQLARQVRRACLPAQMLSGLHPMMQAMTVLVMEAARDGLHAGYGQEFMLAGFARARGLNVVSLETPERQLAALVPADPVQAERAVALTVEQLDSGLARRVLQRMAAAWERGDLDELADYERWCDCMNTAEERALLVALNDERNPAMADKVTALHGEGRRLFVAVGALHMTGPKALPELLRARGFQVERVAFQ